jgi:hypothetical protein
VRTIFAVLVLCAALGLTACGSSKSNNTSTPSSGASSTGSNGSGYPATGGYTQAVKDKFVSGCTSDGKSPSVCSCIIDAIATNVPYAEFVTPTAKFDSALKDAQAACEQGQGGQGTDTQGGQGTDTQGGQGTDTQGGQGTDTQGGQGTDTQGGQGTDTQGGQQGTP